MGLNGSGKTTLLKAILGLKKSRNGVIIVDGQNINDLSTGERAKLMSMVFSREVSANGLDVISYLELGRVPYLNWTMKLNQEDNRVVEEVICKLNLESFKYKQLSKLSDGEKQRVAIAKSLVQDPHILLLDEPSSHLDLKGKQVLFNTLYEISKSKLVLFISHELDLVEKFADEVFLLHEKKVKVIHKKDKLKSIVYNSFGLEDPVKNS